MISNFLDMHSKSVPFYRLTFKVQKTNERGLFLGTIHFLKHGTFYLRTIWQAISNFWNIKSLFLLYEFPVTGYIESFDRFDFQLTVLPPSYAIFSNAFSSDNLEFINHLISVLRWWLKDSHRAFHQNHSSRVIYIE